MSTSKSVLVRNFEAVALLKNGETTESVEILRSALEELKGCFESATSGRQPQPEAMETQRSSGATDQPAVRSISVVDDEAALQSCVDSNQLFDFFPRAFVLSSDASNERAVVALLYNLALTHDMQALWASDPSVVRACQIRALTLYTSALTVARNSWESADVIAMRCVLVAIVNNLGRIHSIHLSFVDTKYLMLLAMDLLDSPQACAQIEEDDYLALSSSVAPFMCMGDRMLSAAPSA